MGRDEARADLPFSSCRSHLVHLLFQKSLDGPLYTPENDLFVAKSDAVHQIVTNCATGFRLDK